MEVVIQINNIEYVAKVCKYFPESNGLWYYLVELENGERKIINPVQILRQPYVAQRIEQSSLKRKVEGSNPF